jgi:hypothetical protein
MLNFLETFIAVQLVMIFPAFMEPKDSPTCSKNTTVRLTFRELYPVEIARPNLS